MGLGGMGCLASPPRPHEAAVPAALQRPCHSLPYTLGAIPPPLPRQYLMGYSFQTWPQPDKTAPILSGSSSGFTFLLCQSGFDL